MGVLGCQRNASRVRVRLRQKYSRAWLLQCFCIYGRMLGNNQIAHPDSSVPSSISSQGCLSISLGT